MKKEKRFQKFLQREGAFSRFMAIVSRNIDVYDEIENLPPQLFLGWHFQRYLTSIEEMRYWHELDRKWNRILQKDYAIPRIIKMKRQRVVEALMIMNDHGDTDEVCRFYSKDVKALENAIRKLDYQLARWFRNV